MALFLLNIIEEKCLKCLRECYLYDIITVILA